MIIEGINIQGFIPEPSPPQPLCPWAYLAGASRGHDPPNSSLFADYMDFYVEINITLCFFL